MEAEREQGGPVVAAADWRWQLQPEARQTIVNKILETLRRHLPRTVPEGLHELRKIATLFEDKIFTGATSQSDYLRKISLKMLLMEGRTQQHAEPGDFEGDPSNALGVII